MSTPPLGEPNKFVSFGDSTHVESRDLSESREPQTNEGGGVSGLTLGMQIVTERRQWAPPSQQNKVSMRMLVRWVITGEMLEY